MVRQQLREYLSLCPHFKLLLLSLQSDGLSVTDSSTTRLTAAALRIDVHFQCYWHFNSCYQWSSRSKQKTKHMFCLPLHFKRRCLMKHFPPHWLQHLSQQSIKNKICSRDMETLEHKRAFFLEKVIRCESVHVIIFYTSPVDACEWSCTCSKAGTSTACVCKIKSSLDKCLWKIKWLTRVHSVW